MTYPNESEDRELARRLDILDDPINQGEGFGLNDWAWLIALGVALPAALLIWGWF